MIGFKKGIMNKIRARAWTPPSEWLPEDPTIGIPVDNGETVEACVYNPYDYQLDCSAWGYMEGYSAEPRYLLLQSKQSGTVRLKPGPHKLWSRHGWTISFQHCCERPPPCDQFYIQPLNAQLETLYRSKWMNLRFRDSVIDCVMAMLCFIGYFSIVYHCLKFYYGF